VASGGPERTEAIGEAWGRVLAPGDVLLLTGDLGAGKTTLVRGLARGLGVAHGVKSPTFAILLTYPGRLPLHHLDLYRVSEIRDVEELGVDDLFAGPGVTVVEWGERAVSLAPEASARIRFAEPAPETRRLEVRGPADIVGRLARAVGAAPEEAR
jgi:tRNA threonylcarbamoyladenosine biosynthesis protein TsaE